MKNAYYKAIAYGAKRSGISFNEVKENYRAKAADLKGKGHLAQGVIYARERYAQLTGKTKVEVPAEAES